MSGVTRDTHDCGFCRVEEVSRFLAGWYEVGTEQLRLRSLRQHFCGELQRHEKRSRAHLRKSMSDPA